MIILHVTAERQVFARRAKASEEVMKERMSDAKVMVQEEKLSKREITYGKTLQLYLWN